MLHAQNHNWVWRSSILPCCDQIRDFISNLENSLDLSLIFPVFFILHHLKNTAADRLMGSLLNMGNPRLITTSALFVQIRNFREITSLNNFLGRKYFSSSFSLKLADLMVQLIFNCIFLVWQKSTRTPKNSHWARQLSAGFSWNTCKGRQKGYNCFAQNFDLRSI